jgi:hypothetical protein
MCQNHPPDQDLSFGPYDSCYLQCQDLKQSVLYNYYYLFQTCAHVNGIERIQIDDNNVIPECEIHPIVFSFSFLITFTCGTQCIQ